MTDQEQNVVIIHTYLQKAVINGDLESLECLFDPDAISYGLLGQAPVLGIKGQRRFIGLLHSLLRDIHVTIEDTIAVAEKVAIRFRLCGATFQGVQKPLSDNDEDGWVALICYAIYDIPHATIRDNWTHYEFIDPSFDQRTIEALDLRHVRKDEDRRSLEDET